MKCYSSIVIAKHICLYCKYLFRSAHLVVGKGLVMVADLMPPLISLQLPCQYQPNPASHLSYLIFILSYLYLILSYLISLQLPCQYQPTPAPHSICRYREMQRKTWFFFLSALVRPISSRSTPTGK